MSANTQSSSDNQQTSENNIVTMLINSQQDTIASLKLSLKLIDGQIPALTQAAEIWKTRYEELEKKYLELLNQQ